MAEDNDLNVSRGRPSLSSSAAKVKNSRTFTSMLPHVLDIFRVVSDCSDVLLSNATSHNYFKLSVKFHCHVLFDVYYVFAKYTLNYSEIFMRSSEVEGKLPPITNFLCDGGR
jgi:hypothetical protein